MTDDLMLRDAQQAAKQVAIEHYASARLSIRVHEQLPQDGGIYRTWPERDFRYVTVMANSPMRIGGSATLYVLNKASNEIVAVSSLAYE